MVLFCPDDLLEPVNTADAGQHAALHEERSRYKEIMWTVRINATEPQAEILES